MYYDANNVQLRLHIVFNTQQKTGNQFAALLLTAVEECRRGWLSGLGAFVHPMRLTFMEYFKNAGYEGKGAAYNPLTTNKE